MTKSQIQLIHVAASKAGLIDGKNDQAYRTLLRNVGGVESCKDMTQAGFEDCMAVIEDCGFRDPKGPEDRWRRKVSERGVCAGSRMVWKIRELAVGGRYELAAMCRKFSDGRTGDAEALKPREAWKLIEMLKAAERRE